MEPSIQAKVSHLVNVNVIYIDFARYLETQTIQQMQEHYSFLPGFELRFTSPVKACITLNPCFAQRDGLRDLANLLSSIGITKVHWSSGLEVSSDSLEELLVLVSQQQEEDHDDD